MIDFKALSAPFPPDRVSWRVGSKNKDGTKGMALAYIDARDVMERLDAVCGPAGWQCRYPHANGKTVCEIGLRIVNPISDVPPEWIWKADGAGDTDFEAEKGALSDAFKRAAVRWGIGRYLYDLSAPWVAIEPLGKSYKIADAEMPKLRALLVKDAAAPAVAAAPSKTGALIQPAADADPVVWQDFAKAKATSALKLTTTAKLDAWQDENKDALDAIKRKSAKLHEWLGQQITAHHNALARKEAA